MTWYLLAHILYKMYETTGRLDFEISEIENVLREMYCGYGVSIVDNREMLLDFLELLEYFRMVKLVDNRVVIVPDRLRYLEEIINRDIIMSGSTYLAYLRKRIDNALSSVLKKL